MGIKKSGFTFIEMVVVVATIAFALPALFAIIFTILQQQTKIMHLTEAKREGDYAMNVMENLIRGYATKTLTSYQSSTEVCATTAPSFPVTAQVGGFKNDNTGATFGFDGSSSKIASQSSVLNANADLTDPTKVTVTGFSMTCTRTNPYSPPVINIQYDVAYSTTSTRAEDITGKLHYQTAVQMKSY